MTLVKLLLSVFPALRSSTQGKASSEPTSNPGPNPGEQQSSQGVPLLPSPVGTSESFCHSGCGIQSLTPNRNDSKVQGASAAGMGMEIPLGFQGSWTLLVPN